MVATKVAIRNRSQSILLLLFHQVDDVFVLYLTQFPLWNFSQLEFVSSLQKFCWAEKRSHLVGTIRGARESATPLDRKIR